VYDFGRSYGESCYRLMSRTGQFIYLKTRGCLEVDDKTRQVHSFVCVNTLVSDEEGRRLIREMKKKFSAIISESELSAMESDVPAVENPQQLERAILNLITNLNNASTYDDDAMSTISDSTIDEDARNKSPPLAIIPPKAGTIKTSIFKAADFIAGQAIKGKDMNNIKDEPKSPEMDGLLMQSPPPSVSVKTEPPTSILSPTSSSMSSLDSDISSPYLCVNQVTSMACSSTETYTTTSSCNRSMTSAAVTNGVDELFNLPIYDIDAEASTSPGMKNNNNSSNNNRNSVLKRTYTSDGDDYSELIKKRAIDLTCAVTPNPPLELLASSDSGELLI